MDQAEAEARMREVQRIMERTTLYTLLPGAVALLCFPQYGVVSAALSFGLFPIVFGLIVVSRSRRSTAT